MPALSSTESPIKIYYVPEVKSYFFKYSIAKKYGNPIDVTLKFKFWTDPRPLIPNDLKILKEVSNIDREFIEKILKIVKKGTSIVNTVNDPTLDMIYEYMTNGEHVCTVNYDMFNNKFIITLGKVATALAYLEGYRYVRSEFRKLEKDTIDLPNNTPIILVDSRDRIWGSGLVINRRIRIVRIWNPENSEDILERVDVKGVDYRKLYEYNIDYIEERLRKVKKVVEYFERKHCKKGILSFSGGKDSLLALLLLKEAESNVDVVHVHIEHGDPEKLQDYIDYVESKVGVKINRILTKWSFIEKYLKILNMPSRGFRWCTPLLKFVNILKYVKELYGFQNIVSYVGSRKSETIKRSIRPATYIDSEAGLLTHAVCYKFPKLLEYLYIWYREKIRLFIDYMNGIERLSCIICPFKSCLEIKICEEKYNEDFQYWKPYIYKLLKSIVRDEKDLDKAYSVHLWRFFMLHTDTQYISGKLGIKIYDPYTCQLKSLNYVEIVNIEKNVKPLKVLLKIPIVNNDVKILLNNLSTIFKQDLKIYLNDNILNIYVLDVNLSIDISRGFVYACSENVENIINVCKVVFMSLSCTSCSHCIYNCPVDCIDIPFRVDKDRCISCLRCLDACIPSRFFFDMILYSEFTSIKKARERIESIREKYKEILMKARIESGLDWLMW